MLSQLDFFNRDLPLERDAAALRQFLAQHDWLQRDDVGRTLNWNIRRVREAAEHLGPDIIRAQRGYKLTDRLTRDDLPAAQQAADAALSQAKKQQAYGLALLHKLHTLVG